jgi:tetratricopeptide (TPR) repeat protein
MDAQEHQDPEHQDPLSIFASRLRKLRIDAGLPSIRALESHMKAGNHPFSRSTIEDKLQGKTTPSWEFVVAFVHACRRHAGEVDRRLSPEAADLAVWRDSHNALIMLLASARQGQRRYLAAERQLAAQTGETLDPEQRAPHADLHQLPPDVADFTGRGPLLETLRQLVTARRNTAIVISAINGRGGVGKTALAVRAAHELKEHFPGGQLYVNLRGVEQESRAPDAVLMEFLTALGVRGAAMPQTLDERSRLFRSKLHDLRALVVLDNAESEAQVRPLLPGSSAATVLITSRKRLSGLEGVSNLRLEVLERRQSVELLAQIVGSERVHREQSCAERIADLCGNLPLAIRIAGARLAEKPHWSLGQLEQKLRDERRRLDELRVGDLEVRASLDLSYFSCGELDRKVFSLLGALRCADFPTWVAAALCETTDEIAEESLERLVQAQLLEPLGLDAADQARYRFHDLVRDYARDTLRRYFPDSVDGLQRVLDGYVALSGVAEQKADVASRDVEITETCPWLAPDRAAITAATHRPTVWFVAENRNILSIIDQAVDEPLSDRFIALVTNCQIFFETIAAWSYWESTHEKAIPRARRRADPFMEARLIYGLGVLAWDKARWTVAHARFDQCLQVFTQLGHDHWRARTLHNIGGVLRDDGSYEKALTFLERAIEVFSELEDTLWYARTLRRMGGVYWDTGDLDAAVQCLERSLPTLREFGDGRWEARGLRTLGGILVSQRRLTEARRCLDSCIAAFGALGDRLWVARSLRTLGECQQQQGEWSGAHASFEAALTVFRDLGDQRYEALTVLNISELALMSGDVPYNPTKLREALAVFEHFGDRQSARKCRDLL